MAVKIRLSRIGKKKVPFFRIVAVDERKKRDGACLDDIGTYNALKSKIVTFKDDLMQKWLEQGAVPTDSVKKIYRLYKKSMPASAASKITPNRKQKSSVAQGQ